MTTLLISVAALLFITQCQTFRCRYIRNIMATHGWIGYVIKVYFGFLCCYNMHEKGWEVKNIMIHFLVPFTSHCICGKVERKELLFNNKTIIRVEPIIRIIIASDLYSCYSKYDYSECEVVSTCLLGWRNDVPSGRRLVMMSSKKTCGCEVIT